MEETRTIAKFVRETRYESIPIEVVEEFKIFVLDTIAAGLVGSVQPWSRIIIDMVRRLGGREEASLFNCDWKADVSRAALANGSMIGAFECNPLTGTHASGTVLPAVMAMSERDRLSGGKFLTSLIVGAEVSGRLGRTAVALESERGFHNPGVLGPVAAAAAVANLYQFDEDTVVNALGIACSHAGGLLEFAWEGANTKRIHEGRAAQLGLESALLAQAGFSGPSTILEGRYGFFNAFSMPAKLEPLTSGLGHEWAVQPPSHKAYPAHATHQPIIQAIQDFKLSHSFDAQEIQRVSIRGEERMMEDRHTVRDPKSIMGGQYSLPFTVAVALTRDLSNPLLYNEAVLTDPTVLDLAQRIELTTNQARDGQTTTTEVTLELDGSAFTLSTGPAKGSPRNPFTWDDACEKFTRYAAGILDEARQQATIEGVKHLETIPNLADLTAAFLA